MDRTDGGAAGPAARLAYRLCLGGVRALGGTSARHAADRTAPDSAVWAFLADPLPQRLKSRRCCRLGQASDRRQDDDSAERIRVMGCALCETHHHQRPKPTSFLVSLHPAAAARLSTEAKGFDR